MAVPKPTEDLHTITCIHCQQQQQVARRAISAVCKYCHKALKFDGRGAFAQPPPPKVTEDLRTVACTHCNQEQQVARRAISAVCKYCHKAMRFDGSTPASTAPKTTEELQSILCVHCYQPQEVARRALSATCKFCHKPLKFDAVMIKAYEARRQLATCGIITIEKSGNAIIDSIKCTGLVVRGKVKGNIECLGTVLVGPKAEIKGDVNAPTLAVSAGAVLDGQYDIGPKPVDAATPPPT